jgi:hypothetical protein
LKALTEQVEVLQKLKGHQYDEADEDGTLWTYLTQSYIETFFGNPSPTLDRLYAAGSPGVISLGVGTRPQEYQSRFEARVTEHEALLQSLIAVAWPQFPEDKINATYAPGEQYDFYLGPSVSHGDGRS